MKMSEYELQSSICHYIRLRYPSALFVSDLGGIRLPIGLAMKTKRLRCERGWPDLFIANPVPPYAGLFLELKTLENDPYLKNGELSKNAHVREQLEVLKTLDKGGYFATFAVGFEHAIAVIDAYMACEIYTLEKLQSLEKCHAIPC